MSSTDFVLNKTQKMRFQHYIKHQLLLSTTFIFVMSQAVKDMSLGNVNISLDEKQ